MGCMFELQKKQLQWQPKFLPWRRWVLHGNGDTTVTFALNRYFSAMFDELLH